MREMISVAALRTRAQVGAVGHPTNLTVVSFPKKWTKLKLWRSHSQMGWTCYTRQVDLSKHKWWTPALLSDLRHSLPRIYLYCLMRVHSWVPPLGLPSASVNSFTQGHTCIKLLVNEGLQKPGPLTSIQDISKEPSQLRVPHEFGWGLCCICIAVQLLLVNNLASLFLLKWHSGDYQRERRRRGRRG